MSHKSRVLDDETDNTTEGATILPVKRKYKAKGSRAGQEKRRKAKRHCGDSVDTKVDQAGESKVDHGFTSVDCVDGNVQCVFLDSECIPLWPQYKHKTQEGRFVRIGKWEPWVIQVIAMCRKIALKGYEPQQCKEKRAPFARKLVDHVVTELHHDFRQVLKEARKEHIKTNLLRTFPEVFSINMHGCEVVASTMTIRHIYILAGDETTKWIHSGIAPAVQTYLEKELNAMSPNFSPPYDDRFSDDHHRTGVRNKVIWMARQSTWTVLADCEKGEEKRYCEKNCYDLSVPRSMGGSEEYKAARDVAFHNACVVWNEVDRSDKPRIKLITRPLRAPMKLRPKRKAMSHTESESDSSTEAAEDLREEDCDADYIGG